MTKLIGYVRGSGVQKFPDKEVPSRMGTRCRAAGAGEVESSERGQCLGEAVVRLHRETITAAGDPAAGRSRPTCAVGSLQVTTSSSRIPQGGRPLDARLHGQIVAAHAAITQTWGAVSDVVLSAGRNSPKRTWADQSMDEVEAIINTNFTAVVRTVDVVLPGLRAAGGGQIIVVSSYSSWRFTPYAGVAYSASKSALLALCQTLNAQEAGNGIRACHLCPGDVDSDFLRFRPVVPNAEARSGMLSPEDVGRAVKFVLDSPSHVRIDELVISPISQV